MDALQNVRQVVETIVVGNITDVHLLESLLGGTFQVDTKPMPYHQKYQGSMAPNSYFDACELRLPKSPAATSALMTCTLASRIDISASDVQEAYKDHVQFEPAPARGSAAALSYLKVSDGQSKVSFGFLRDQERISTIVIDLKPDPN